ncbi:MAG: sensor histidine kinase [Actinomycetota bacterium]
MGEPPAAGPRARRGASIRLRILAAALAVVTVALGLGAVTLVWTLERMLQASVAEQLSDELGALAEGIDQGTIQTAALVERDDDILVALHADAGVVVNAEPAAQVPVPDGREPIVATVADERHVVVSAGVDAGTIVVARSLDAIDDAVRSATALLAVAVPLAVILVGTVVWIVVDRALAPVERIRAEVDAIDASALDRRVQATGRGDELDRLAGTMNRMLARVEDGARSRRRFVSDASHELRSPLATMRQFAELARSHPEAVAPGELADVVVDEGERMHGIVEGLLLLARLDEHAVDQRRPVDLDDLAHAEVAHAEVARVRSLGRAADGAAVRAAPVVGDERLLRRACRNLVDNALRHARERVAIGSTVRDGRAMLWVDDDGAGVPPADRERVFERFVRLDEARARDDGGSGLGLAIVREVARAHGGDAWVTSAPAGGARFVLELPVAAGGADA